MNIVRPYSSRLWQVGDYPSDNVIQAVTQTPDGFLWLATQGGLGRFIDGEFEWVPVVNEKEIGSERITALCLDKEAGIWVAGATAGLARFKDGKTTRHALPKGIDQNILSLHAAGDGSIWIAARNGLVRFQNETFTVVGNKDQQSNIFWARHGSDNIRSFFEDEKHQLWVGIDDQLVTLRAGEVVANYSLTEFRPDFIRVISGDRSGNIWVGSNAGLFHFKNGKFTQYSKADGLPDNNVTAVYEDRHGTLWVGTVGGLCRLVNEQFVVEMTSQREAFDHILCFFEDRENNLWVGAKDGLHQLNAQPFTTFTTRQGLAHNNVTSICEDRDGGLWIGTWGGGLNHLRDGKLVTYSTANTNALWNDLVLAIRPSRDGGIWFGQDYDGGLYRFKDGVFRRWGQSEGLGRNAIRTLLEDRKGRLLIGFANGPLRILENEKLSSPEMFHRPELQGIWCLLETKDGSIWMGNDRGLICWSNQTITTFTTKDGLANNAVLSLFEDKEQTLWVGTAYGLNHFKDGKFFHYKIEQRFYEDYSILEILEDDFGHLWLATRRGLVRLSKKEIADFEAGKIKNVTWTTLGKGDGMNRVICVGTAKPSAWKGKDHRMWFATSKGLTMLDTKVETKRNEVAPTVVIRKVLIDTKSVPVSLWGTETLPDWGADTIKVAPGYRELEFRFTGLSYVAPEKNRYRYKLEGLENDWVEAGPRRAAFYNSVPPGEYTFRVIACNNEGVWNSTGSSVKLSLLPHFWQTTWFYTLVALAGVAVVGGTARYITWRKVQRELEKHEQQHAIERERARIAQDLHDHLGAGLTQVALLGEMTKRNAEEPAQAKSHAKDICQISRELAQTVDEIVWAVDPQNDTLNQLAAYVAVYAEDFFQAASLKCRMDIPPGLPSIPLSAEMRHSLFSVLKEALNNIVKHADATEVTIRLTHKDSKLELLIADNGKGFSRENARAGHGLANMEKRIQTLGGRFEIQTAPGKGTQITLTVPLPH